MIGVMSTTSRCRRNRALQLPPGTGVQLKHDMEQLIEELRTALSSAFESEEYRDAAARPRRNSRSDSRRVSRNCRSRPARRSRLLRTPGGLAFAPLREGEVLPPEEFQKLPPEEQKRIEEEVEGLQQQLQRVLLKMPRWEREFRSRLRELQQEVSGFVLSDLMEELYEKYKDLPDVISHLQAVQKDVSENLGNFLESDETKAEAKAEAAPVMPDGLKIAPALRRYLVNVLVDASEAKGAPVIYESNPSYLNLVGRVEQMAMMGALVTDFTLIKPGALHQANGGYLILDALKALTSPYAWEGLKRALQFGDIRIESPVQMMSLTSTVSLEPEPIPLDIKVILVGDRMIYYLLAQADPEFGELFKVAADFEDEFVRDEETTKQYARLIATMVRKENLLPFEKGAVCRVIEESARAVEDAERMTARMRNVVDLMEESDHWARAAQAERVAAEHVEQAIAARIYRSDRVSRRMQEEVLRGTILIDTEGEAIGQINGLSVIQMGGYAFGKPARITASVRIGRGEVVDIEREVELSGPLHSKGVLILSSFIKGRYAVERPLSLGASLVFEQSYGGVDGDSASSTELYALLSAIARVPLKQSLAVTGSVNQYGRVQAIGGVNEKIEGFFDLCAARGLTGDQGVLIPASNVKHRAAQARTWSKPRLRASSPSTLWRPSTRHGDFVGPAWRASADEDGRYLK